MLQLLFFTLFGGICLWVAIDINSLQAAPTVSIAASGTILDPTPGILFDELPQQRQQGLLDRWSGGWFGMMMMIVGIGFSAWSIALRIWHLLFRLPILSVRDRQLVRHSDPFWPKRIIALGDIRAVVCDRADRVAGGKMQLFMKETFPFTYAGMRLAQKMRHILLITYVDQHGETHMVTVTDINVDGGREQLERFAGYFRTMVAGERRD